MARVASDKEGGRGRVEGGEEGWGEQDKVHVLSNFHEHRTEKSKWIKKYL